MRAVLEESLYFPVQLREGARAPGLVGGHGPKESEGRKFEIVDLSQFSVGEDTEARGDWMVQCPDFWPPAHPP